MDVIAGLAALLAVGRVSMQHISIAKLAAGAKAALATAARPPYYRASTRPRLIGPALYIR